MKLTATIVHSMYGATVTLSDGRQFDIQPLMEKLPITSDIDDDDMSTLTSEVLLVCLKALDVQKVSDDGDPFVSIDEYESLGSAGPSVQVYLDLSMPTIKSFIRNLQ